MDQKKKIREFKFSGPKSISCRVAERSVFESKFDLDALQNLLSHGSDLQEIEIKLEV